MEHDLPLPAVGFQYGLGRCRPRTLLDTWSCDQWKTTGAAAPLSAQFPARGLRPENVPPCVVVADRARTVGGDRSGSRRCPLVERSTPYDLVQAVRLARACGQTPAAAAPPLVSQSRGRQPRRPTITTLILLKSDVVTRESVWGRAQRRQHGGNKYRGISGFQPDREHIRPACSRKGGATGRSCGTISGDGGRVIDAQQPDRHGFQPRRASSPSGGRI
jgi:hypothetical protein